MNIDLLLNQYYNIIEVKKYIKSITFLKKYFINLAQIIPINRFEFLKDEVTLEIDSSYIVKILKFLKLYVNSQFSLLTYIAGVDYPEKKKDLF